MSFAIPNLLTARAERTGVSRRTVAAVWLATIVAIVVSTVAAGLWSTRKIGLYELAVIGAASVCVWLVGARLILSRRVADWAAAIFVAAYMAGDAALALRAIARGGRLTGDYAIFSQSLWWTLHGQPLWNSTEGTSHLGFHASYILFALVPLYALFHTTSVLALVQAVTLAAGGWLLYRLARRYLSPAAGVLLTVVFLLYPAYQYDFGDFYEASLAPPFLLLMIDGGLRRRWRPLLVGAAIAMTVKESFPLIVILYGLYLVWPRRWIRGGVTLIVLGAAVLLVDLRIAIPYFLHHYAAFSTKLPIDPEGNLRFALSHPSAFAAHLFEGRTLRFVIADVGPYLAIPFVCSLLWLIALPDLALSVFGGVLGRGALAFNFGGRFAMGLAAGVGAAAVLTLGRLRERGPGGIDTLVAMGMFFASIALVPSWLNSTHLDARAPAELATIRRYVAPMEPVAVPLEIAAAFDERPVMFDLDWNARPAVIARCARVVVTERARPHPGIRAAIEAAGFRRVWVGHAYQVWVSPRHPSCSPTHRPW